MAKTTIPIELSSTPSIVDGGNATAITIDSSENVTFAGGLVIPSTITHAGDTDTKLDFNQANTLRLITGDNTAWICSASSMVINEDSIDFDFRVESNGNANMLFVDGGNDRVGINGTGTNARGGSNTVAVFDVSGSGKNYVEIQGATDSTANGLLFSDGSSGNYGVVGYNHASDNMNFFTAGSERMRIDSAGDVGIGVSDPLSKLHVHNASSATNRIARFESTIDNLNEYTAITVGKQGTHVASMGIQLLAVDQMFLGVTNNGNTFNPGTGGTGTGLFLSAAGNVRTPGQTYFAVRRSGNQTIGATAWTDINWDSETTDTGSNISSGTFTAPVAGVYLFTGLVGFDTITATNYLLARIECSTAGSQYITHEQKRSGGGDYGYDAAISDMITLAANETVKIQVFAGGGGDHTFAGRSRWQGRLLG